MKVTVSVITREQFAGDHVLRPGTVGGDWLIQVQDLTDPEIELGRYQGSKTVATFDLPQGQDVQVRAVRLDDQGEPIGPMAVLQYTVGDPALPIDVADRIEVT